MYRFYIFSFIFFSSITWIHHKNLQRSLNLVTLETFCSCQIRVNLFVLSLSIWILVYICRSTAIIMLDRSMSTLSIKEFFGCIEELAICLWPVNQMSPCSTLECIISLNLLIVLWIRPWTSSFILGKSGTWSSSGILGRMQVFTEQVQPVILVSLMVRDSLGLISIDIYFHSLYYCIWLGV